MQYIEEYSFTTADNFFNYIAPWGTDPVLGNYVFRGHSQESYLLVPTALRADQKSQLWKISGLGEPDARAIDMVYFQVQAEYQILRSFYKLADQRGLEVPLSPRVREGLVAHNSPLIMFKATSADKWIPTDMHEAAALAQHYGMPTSLLDWTYDIFVAMYFAFKGAIGKSGNMCIWCINMEHISFLTPTVESLGVDFVTPHYSGNPHLNAQKGLFTHVPGLMPHIVRIQENPTRIAELEAVVDRRPLDVVIDERLQKRDTNIFKKFYIPCSEAKKGCQILERMGYDAARIFPGYGGVAKQIMTRDEYL